MYKVRKYYIPRDKVGNILRVVLSINFSVIRIKIKVKYKVIKSILNI